MGSGKNLCLTINYFLLLEMISRVKKKYLIFGDSHSRFFTRRKYKDLEIHLYRIRGASMAGFGKRESTLKVADSIR